LAFVLAFAALAAGLCAPVAPGARLAFGFALLSVIIRPFLFDASQVASGVQVSPQNTPRGGCVGAPVDGPKAVRKAVIADDYD
jgi:hypothetical protein